MAPSLHSFFNFVIGRGRSTGTSRGRIVALSLLGWEFFKAGSIPPVTLGLIGFIVSVFLKLFSFLARARLKDVCVSVYHVWDKGDYRRLVVAPIVHADEWHLYYNMASLLWKGKILERRLGSCYYAYLIAAFTLLTSLAYILLNIILSEVFEDDSHVFSCAIGFSGVLFAMKVLTTFIEPPSTTLLLGFIPISSKWASWAELILIQILVPHTSFTGHLAGILVGIAYTRGPLKRIVDIPFLSLFGYVPVVHGYETYEGGSSSNFSSSSSYASRQNSTYSRQNSTYSRQNSQYSRQPSRSHSRQDSHGPSTMSGDYDLDDISEELGSEASAGVDLAELRRRRAQRFTT